MKRIVMATVIPMIVGCSANEALNNLNSSLYAAPPDVVTVHIQDYLPQTGDTFQNLFVSNYSVDVSQGQLLYSTARDMADSLKQSLNGEFGFTVNSPESVVIGFADLMLYEAGITIPQQTQMACASNLLLSSSNDALIYNDDRVSGNPATFMGLRDCEKLYMGLNPQKFNYNGNGIPDYLQMRCGMNPLDKNEAFISTAGDGVADIDKCKRHIPIDENYYSQPNQLFAYQYNTVSNQDGSSDLLVGNIPILNGGAENFISIYVTEVNPSTNIASLYTAYAILKSGYSGKTLQFDYWGTNTATLNNQEIVVP